ncbi:MAG: 50S ribosomal protein L25/general stress protein Ctc [Deltaproteobacteria bacterium]|nr:50S ribosomal protein L25/general stress protein Ctc [Deltaproteobacteria bacterium]MBW1793656.1 50S ribosomal protein L25/general stress protein Ctc [Deltaproteobacteria bacterium]MBW2331304.1 50S ribosomal protein L25/general stress protein Ctc [Deltaproteobacteria bacterium]
MEIFDLKSTQRNTFGKNSARALRRQGLIPAVLYGPKTESVPLTISPLDLDNVYKASGTERVVLNLIIENGGTQNATAVVKEVQASPVTGQYLHIDFYEISLDEEIVVNVPIEVTGRSKGVERGGFLQVVRYELEISCLPADMPDKIEVDVTGLDIGDSIHIGDIDLGDKVRLLADTGFTVATVVAPTVEEEEIPEEELEVAEEAPAEEAEAGAETANK